MVVPTDTLAESDGPLLEVVQVGPLAVDTKIFAAIALFAVANTALINMIMASRLRLRDGAPGDRPVGARPGRRRPRHAAGWRSSSRRCSRSSSSSTGDLATLADMTVLLLLLVFAVVNVCVLVLRRDPVDHDHFRIPTWVPIFGFFISFAVMTTKDLDIFARAGVLLVIGVALYGVERAAHRAAGPVPDGGAGGVEGVARRHVPVEAREAYVAETALRGEPCGGHGERVGSFSPVSLRTLAARRASAASTGIVSMSSCVSICVTRSSTPDRIGPMRISARLTAHSHRRMPGAVALVHPRDRLFVVGVVAVEEADEDVAVEDDYAHPRRTSSRYPSGKTSQSRLPACWSMSSRVRTSSTRPGPTARMRRSSPAVSPASRMTSAGMVIWFFRDTALMCFTVSPSGKAMSGPIVTKSSHSLVVDAESYLPFEPRHEDQQRLRAVLRQALGELAVRDGDVLHARLGGAGALPLPVADPDAGFAHWERERTVALIPATRLAATGCALGLEPVRRPVRRR